MLLLMSHTTTEPPPRSKNLKHHFDEFLFLKSGKNIGDDPINMNDNVFDLNKLFLLFFSAN